MTTTTVTAEGAAILERLHPVVRTWFERRFGEPTDAQTAGWPHIMSGVDTLLAAPTGSGKTLAAFLTGIDALVRQAERGELTATTSIVYISPLKALSNDIERNLDEPLEGIKQIAEELGYDLPEITTGVRTGDTPQSERQKMVRKPPHILITTPESLYLLITAARSRETLRNVRTVIVDEIHALARDRRGSHLALTLERLDHVTCDVERGGCGRRPARVGLSATQNPIEELAHFLVGSEQSEGETASVPRPCQIVNLGHQRDIELHVEVPPSDLEAVAAKEQWADVYDRLAQLVEAHHTTLIFVNTRKLAERIAHKLSERLGEDAVSSHHGSLSKERRLRVERRLKAGNMKALVATASLELGIDIGSIDLVCQIGSPQSIATFLQRVGRSGHALGLRPHGRLFPTSRDELIECAALVRAARAGRLDRVIQPVAPIDVLAQQIVAETACEDWDEAALYERFRTAAPFATLTRERYEEIVEVLATGIGDGAGRAPPLVHRDRINGVLRGRRAARLTAILNGGTIPETGDYNVIAEPDDTLVGTVNEDFAIESFAGDIFLLGTTSWQILRVEQSTVRVRDARGAPPTIPFWLGEAPGRTIELSEEVGQLRRDIAGGLDGDREALRARLIEECAVDELGAQQMIDYIRATRDGLGIGVIPSDTDVVFERFFDDSGGQQLVVHAPFGQRINRAWGLALRKRFCVNFDFELQASANDDAMLLSTGPQHSFALEEAFDWVTPRNVETAVHQSIFYIPLFGTRWRWNATRALAVPRQRAGKRVPPFIQRMRSDDLMAAVFPEQVGCQENLSGPLTLPDHPLMRQTMHDCLREAMDIDALKDVLERVERGEIRYHAVDTTEPSPMAHEIITGKPFTFLDDAPLEERRTRAVTLRRTLPEEARDLGALDSDAIERVSEEAWPDPRDAEETHDALLGLVAVAEPYVQEWIEHLEELADGGRAGRFTVPLEAGETAVWFAAEHIEVVRMLFPQAELPALALPPGVATAIEEREDARMLMLRGHAEAAGPATAAAFALRTGLGETDVGHGLTMLEARGHVLRGKFTPDAAVEEFCDRRLLARIHRYTLDRLRQEVSPGSLQDYMRFLLKWQGVLPRNAQGDPLPEGKAGLRQALTRLQGFEAPAAAWESDLLRARIRDYNPSWLDELCLAGEVSWARLTPRRAASNVGGNGGGNGAKGDDGEGDAPVDVPLTAATRSTPVTIAMRSELPSLLAAARAFGAERASEPESGASGEIVALLRERGALFFDEIVTETRRIATDVEQGLRELIFGGWVTSDGFQGLREVAGGRRRSSRRRRRRRGAYLRGGVFAGGGPPGRWSLVRAPDVDHTGDGVADLDRDGLAEHVAMNLLQRYGVVFRDVVRRESFGLPWRDVLRALRRFEARGTVRGGRFVTGRHGEQYALPEALDALRRMRKEPLDGARVRISAVDPLNLTGHLLPGDRVPAQPGRYVEYLDGLPLDESAPRAAAISLEARAVALDRMRELLAT